MGNKCKNCKYYALMDKTEESLCTLFLDRTLCWDKKIICKISPNSECEMFITEKDYESSIIPKTMKEEESER